MRRWRCVTVAIRMTCQATRSIRWMSCRKIDIVASRTNDDENLSHFFCFLRVKCLRGKSSETSRNTIILQLLFCFSNKVLWGVPYRYDDSLSDLTASLSSSACGLSERYDNFSNISNNAEQARLPTKMQIMYSSIASLDNVCFFSSNFNIDALCVSVYDISRG